MKFINKFISLLIILSGVQMAFGQTETDLHKNEEQFYKIVDIPIPKDIVLEVGGLALTDKDQLGVSTRRGEVWLIDKPYSLNPKYSRYAYGIGK